MKRLDKSKIYLNQEISLAEKEETGYKSDQRFLGKS